MTGVSDSQERVSTQTSGCLNLEQGRRDILSLLLNLYQIVK